MKNEKFRNLNTALQFFTLRIGRYHEIISHLADNY